MNIFTSLEFIVFLPLKLTIGSKATKDMKANVLASGFS